MPFAPQFRLTDLLGFEWDLSAPFCPVRIRTIDGIDGAEWEFDKSNGVNQAGVTINAREDKETIVGMTLWIGPVDPGDGAVEFLRRWRRGLGRGWARKGDLMKLEELSTQRFVIVRLASKPDTPKYSQMYQVGRTEDEVKLLSEESWWRKVPFDRVFTSAEFGSIKVRNDGDEDSWPWYRITGPISNITLGMAGETIPLPSTCNLTAGQWLEIDTDPDRWHVTHSAGGDRTWKVGERWRTKAPAEEPEIPVTISGAGVTTATSLRVVVPQLFHGAL